MHSLQKPLPPSSIIGILGGGQLGRMMAVAAAELGYSVHIYCPEENSPASEVAKFTTNARYDDISALTQFAKSVDVITYEFENIPARPVEEISELVDVFPSPQILAISQNRILEKTAINELGIATAPFAPISSYKELLKAIEKISLPAVLKTTTMGYDGKGQVMLRNNEDVSALMGCEWWAVNGANKNSPITNQQPPIAILEGFVNFKMEISVIVARDRAGNVQTYCPVQNIHKHHILDETIAPAPISTAITLAAEKIAYTLAKGLDLVGLIAVEMFVRNDDEIIVNEIAPRPHNSGHWTLDSCITSQFEQVIRAVCGLPLGNPAHMCAAKMKNLIGNEINNSQKYLTQPNAKLHIYGKKEAKTGRKMGHVTFLEKSIENWRRY
jgi:5-(carboxyamino)imidazole ribonucleotide synthase